MKRTKGRERQNKSSGNKNQNLKYSIDIPELSVLSWARAGEIMSKKAFANRGSQERVPIR
jgi:hypothetical protein